MAEYKKYDKKLDKTIYEDETRFDNQKIKVKISSYDGDEPKMQINREIYDDFRNYYKWSKLGRTNIQESEALIKMMKKAVEKFE